jgi:hypothetical protein
MENFIDYSDYISVAYFVTSLVLLVLMTLIVAKFLKTK